MNKRAMTEAAKKEKANQILDIAAQLLLTTDYRKIRMIDLAKKMGISNGIIYVYFKTKETLFLCLLWREYEKRLAYLAEQTKQVQISFFADAKRMFLAELSHLIDTSPLYIRLATLRTTILEKNTDEAMLEEVRTQFLGQVKLWIADLCQNGVLSPDQVMEIFLMEEAILTGCTLAAGTADDPNGSAAGFGCVQQHFREHVLRGMSCFLDGYELSLASVKEGPQAGPNH